MGNMSYCRFENTYKDLNDCYDSLMETPYEELSTTEKRYAKKLMALMQAFVQDYEDEIEPAKIF